jgi:hypothetical protein
MIVTSKGFRAWLFCWLIVVFSRTGGYAVHRWEKSQRRAAKTLTVTYFQALAFNGR